MVRSFFVYIITNYTNNVFYVGITNNLERRLAEHKSRIDENSFSARYKLYKLIWFQEFPNPMSAIETEKKIKGWRREKKLALIKSLNPSFTDLSKSQKLDPSRGARDDDGTLRPKGAPSGLGPSSLGSSG